MVSELITYFGWFVFSALLMSFIEHQVHRNFMHRRNFFSIRFAPFKKAFEHHAILHHGEYHDIFSDAPVGKGEDHGIRLNIKEGLLEGSPIALAIALVSWKGALIFLGVVALHHYLWGLIHLEMHKPEERFFSNWPLYQHLALHHFLHHKHPDKNFNVVIPVADYVLRTNVPASQREIEEFRAIKGQLALAQQREHAGSLSRK